MSMKSLLVAAGTLATVFTAAAATDASAQQLNQRPGEAGYTGHSQFGQSAAAQAGQRARDSLARGSLIGQTSFSQPEAILLSRDKCDAVQNQMGIHNVGSGAQTTTTVTYNGGEQGTLLVKGDTARGATCTITPKRGF